MTARPARRLAGDTPAPAEPERLYEQEETRELVALVNDAAERVRGSGEAAFDEFRVAGSRWRRDDAYIFVLDPDGRMLVHPDPALEGTSQLDLKDVNGRPIVRGLIAAATAHPDKPEGWYHYQWPVPGGIFPRWKSSYVQLVQAPSGIRHIVGGGMYNDRMERAFVVDMVTNGVAEIEKRGEAAFDLLRDRTGPFIAKDAYIFVIDMDGTELLNPVFPNLEGMDVLDVRDTEGGYPTREMIEVGRTRGSGWVDYMWPKPGESVSTQKSTYVSRARLGERDVIVCCGVYLADAPTTPGPSLKLPAPELMSLVREAAGVLEQRGEEAYAEFREMGSKWFRDDTYFFVYTMDGTRSFHAAEPETEGRNDRELRDIVGRPIGRMLLEAAAGPTGEGWIHYMYPKPGNIFPAWKSSFVKRVDFPSGEPHIVGSGIYEMPMDKAFIEDVVDHAADLVAEQGTEAFDRLRDRTGPFVFMDVYVFVQSPDGTELVNPAFPSLEGRNLMELKDLEGREVVRDQIAATLEQGSAWIEMSWYRPGTNTPARKLTYARQIESGGETCIVGSGLYMD